MKANLMCRQLTHALVIMSLTATSLTSFAQEKNAEAREEAPATTEESSSEPTIKIPRMPPRTPSPAAAPSRPSAASMTALQTSAFTSMTCPLVDNRPLKKLLDATQALAKVVIVTPQCQNNADATKIADEVKKLLTAGTNLQNLWQTPETLTTDPKALASFQGDVGAMIMGFNAVTSSLQNSAFLKSECGKSLSASGILIALSDLVTTFAPFALVGASMNPVMSTALPYILGITGVGAVSKVVRTMVDAGSIDIYKTENRNAILQNICEFSKISQHVRFLKLAQSGQLEQVTQEIQRMRNSTTASLRSQLTDRLSSIANIRATAEQALASADATATKDLTEIKSLLSQLGDGASTCYAAREIVERAGDASIFPTRATQNLQFLLGQQNQTTLSQNVLLRTEERLRNRLKSNINNESSEGVKECAETGKAYLESLNRLVLGTKETIKKLRESLERQLARDPEYQIYRRTEISAQREVENLQQVANVLQKLNMDNAVIDKVEIDAQMAGLKRALFSAPWNYRLMNQIPYVGGMSPAYSWLTFVEEQYNRSLNQFETELNLFLSDAYAITRAGRGDFTRLNQNGQREVDRFGRPIPLSPHEQNQMIFNDIRAANELKNINIAGAPAGSDVQKMICGRLETIWLAWAATMDHLTAQSFFCETIRPLFDNSTESALISRCVDRRDLQGRILVRSEVSQRQTTLAQSDSRKKALLVSAKMKELQCEQPQPLVLK